MGHFEIEGALMIPLPVCSHGLDISYLKRFEKVYSGHFHSKSEVKNCQISRFTNAIHMVRLW